MATNERVSQLLELFATDIQSEDLLLITDMSQRESKKLEVGQLLLFIENSGSFDAFNAAHADTASYISSSAIHGAILVSNASTSSISSSWSNISNSSSYALTASYALNANISSSNTSSYIQYSGFPNGTSSYSLKSNLSDNSVTSFNLFYNGQPNGTASWAINSVSSSYSQTASYSLNSNSSSYSQTASYSLNSNSSSYSTIAANIIGGISSPVKAWAYVTWSVGVSFPLINFNFNISQIKWLNRFTFSGSGIQVNYDQFGVLFSNNLNNTNYILMGDGYQPYNDPERAGIILHPIYSNKTSASFTMSIVTNAVGVSDFYTITSGSYPHDEHSYVNFQILGL